MNVAFPGALIEVHESGSVTAESFATLLMDGCVRPLRAKGVVGPLCLIADSGGGAFLHVSAEIATLCERENVRLFILDPYMTRPLMCLDQTPHAEAARMWAQVKRQAAEAEERLTLFTALQALKPIVEHALSERIVKSGFHRVGMTVSCPIDRNKVLVERASECFSTLPKIDEVPGPVTQAGLLLTPCKVESTRLRCTSDLCKKQVSREFAFCPRCGVRNENHDPVEAIVRKEGCRAGWVASRPNRFDVSALQDAEASRHVGDLLEQLRKRKADVVAVDQDLPALAAAAGEQETGPEATALLQPPISAVPAVTALVPCAKIVIADQGKASAKPDAAPEMAVAAEAPSASVAEAAAEAAAQACPSMLHCSASTAHRTGEPRTAMTLPALRSHPTCYSMICVCGGPAVLVCCRFRSRPWQRRHQATHREPREGTGSYAPTWWPDAAGL